MSAPVRLLAAPLLIAAVLAAGALAQRPPAYETPEETRSAMERALAERTAAVERARRLEAAAERAGEAAQRTASQAAALAARIQESEAGLAIAEARLELIERQRHRLAVRLAERQEPVVRLTGALQRFSRRPLALSVMRPGSVREMVYLRAMLASTLPEVQNRTAALRSEIDRGNELQREAQRTVAALRAEEERLLERRRELSALETRQRLASRQASGDADREAERALALAEEARDLDELIERLDTASVLRDRLAALPGPIIRPPSPADSEVPDDMRLTAAETGEQVMQRLAGYQLPVSGRTVSGFRSPTSSGGLSQGLSLMPRAGAQVVAPAAGRVAFAGPYRGYGRIVILEHEGGWTSLVTGMARVDVRVGEQLMGGAPLGIAGPSRNLITLEVRRNGQPVNPLELLG